MSKTGTTLIFSLLILLTINCKQSSDSDPGPETVSYESTEPARVETLARDKEPTTADLNVSVDNSRRNAITTAVEKASPAIVSITVTELQQGYTRTRDPFFSFFFDRPVQREVQSMGSGFIISPDGLVVTNQHVASESAKTIMVTLPDGSSMEAELLGSDELADLALLKIKSDKKDFPHIKFADSDRVMVGEWAIAMGNPFGLFADGQPTVTVGVVSATKRDFRPDPQEPRVYVDMIQTDAAINRGNSGGPLVNSEGEVIGVNTFIYTGGTSGGFVGLGFAIPSERVQKIIGQLKESGTVTLDFDPGLTFTPMNQNIAYQYGLPNILGILVLSVNKDGPAFEGGIMPGDIIVKIGEERVISDMHAWAIFSEHEEGDTLKVRLIREAKEYEAEIKLRRKVAEN